VSYDKNRPLSPQELHEAMDLLLAQYLMAHPGAYPSRTSVVELMTWSYQRLLRERARANNAGGPAS